MQYRLADILLILCYRSFEFECQCCGQKLSLRLPLRVPQTASAGVMLLRPTPRPIHSSNSKDTIFGMLATGERNTITAKY